LVGWLSSGDKRFRFFFFYRRLNVDFTSICFCCLFRILETFLFLLKSNIFIFTTLPRFRFQLSFKGVERGYWEVPPWPSHCHHGALWRRKGDWWSCVMVVVMAMIIGDGWWSWL
jgi:hypothetical protein